MEETQHKRDVSELGKPRGVLQAAWPVQSKKRPEFQPLAMSFVPLTHPTTHTQIHHSGYWPMLSAYAKDHRWQYQAMPRCPV